jgi:leader peptidase (prepilin peptidase) / N-methyltransferase
VTLATLLISVILFIFLIGLCVGSFLNVVILRAFSDESIVFPGSKCPSCQQPLKWYHNIPVLSYLFLKGKCAFCKEPISKQYPIIEFITGILFVAVFFKFGLGLNSLFMMAIVSLFIVLAVTDIKEKVVFDFHTYILIGIGLIYNLFNIGHLYLGDKVLTLGSFHIGINNSLIASVLGIIAGIIFMEIFARFGYLVAGMRAFGEGDTYIAAGLGAVLGYKYLLTALVYAFVIQIFLTIPVFIKKLYVNKDYRTLISFFVFFGLIVVIKYIDYANITNSFIIFTTLTLFLCAAGFYVCKRVLGGLKNPDNATYLPFGPAMVIGALIKIFLF